MAKILREGISYNHRDVVDLLSDFSAFKDRVEKRFRDLSKELAGKPNEHILWVNLYLVSCDYAEDLTKNRKHQEVQTS
ncbi:MAG: hypothetical protein IBX71_00775 [Candidatus Desulforudis sp.]|nr:hypothetical protein [Desulforudis sp.]